MQATNPELVAAFNALTISSGKTEEAPEKKEKDNEEKGEGGENEQVFRVCV